MRKRVIESAASTEAGDGTWLDLERVAIVEASSEKPGHPVLSRNPSLADCRELARAEHALRIRNTRDFWNMRRSAQHIR